jgi:hypothetical protein
VDRKDGGDDDLPCVAHALAAARAERDDPERSTSPLREYIVCPIPAARSQRTRGGVKRVCRFAQYNILAGYLGSNTEPWFLYGVADLDAGTEAGKARRERHVSPCPLVVGRLRAAFGLWLLAFGASGLFHPAAACRPVARRPSVVR